MKRNILEWFQKTVSDYPGKVAFSDTENRITFKELSLNAKAVGSAIAEISKDDTPVAVFSGRKIETVSAFLGVVYSGHAYAPVDATLPDLRIKSILETLCPKIVIADKDNIERARELGVNSEIVELESLFSHPIDEARLDDILEKSVITDPLYIIFTSGSTGKPKGVITSHHSLMCYIDAYTSVMGIDENDRLGNQSPLDYIAAVRDIYIPLKTGCSTFIIPKEYFMEPDRLFTLMNGEKITAVGWSVSAFTVLTSLGAFQSKKLETLNKICFSGSVMPSKVLKLWQENLPEAKFVNQYGPTEATASCTYYEIDRTVSEDEVLPIGKPYKNYRIVLLDENLKEVRKGELGEICVSGPILALGYYNDPERTAKSFIQNPCQNGFFERMYKTGDIGRINEDGLLEFHGRLDRQIKHMGHRVELDEIEYAASLIEGVKESCCIYNSEKEVLCLLYTGTAKVPEVAGALRKSIPGFMVPRKLVCTESIPRLPNGKTDMNKVKEFFLRNKR
ncbi:MAG TPA: amino acid adenylation protein [Ruminococcaceae bacterium]|nr:amino acid adenylation protein [Oscillospiraceae bacterium]